MFRAGAIDVANYVDTHPKEFPKDILTDPHAIAAILSPFSTLAALRAESMSPEKKDLADRQKKLKAVEKARREAGKIQENEVASKDLEKVFALSSNKVCL